MKSKYKWGIIGPGKIARKFAHDLKFSNGGFLYAIASRSDQRLREFSRDFEVVKKYNQYEDLLTDPDVDAVYIATPHSHHYSWILRCLEHGKHVLCEKPMCINAHQVGEIIRKQRETGLFVMEAMWTRFLPAYLHFREELMQSGQSIQSLTADFCYYSPRGEVARVYEPSLAGGSLLDIGIYPLFLALDLMGTPFEIDSTGWVEEGVDVRQTTMMLYDHGRTAMIYSDVQAHTRMDAVIRMKDRTYILPHQWHKMNEYQTMAGDQTTRHIHDRIGWGYYHEIEHVHDCLDQDLSQSPEYPLLFSLKLATYLDEIRKQIGLAYPDSIEHI